MFTQRSSQKQLCEVRESEFGGDCLLGKLCRLEKPCGLSFDETRFSIARWPLIQRQLREPDEVYLKSRLLHGLLRINDTRLWCVARLLPGVIRMNVWT